MVGSDDTSPFGATKAYFRGEFLHVTHKKSEALEDGFSSPFFKQLNKHSGWLFPAVRGQFQGHPSCFSAWRFFFGAFLEAKEREAWSSKRETKIRSLEVELGAMFFRSMWQERQPDEKT